MTTSSGWEKIRIPAGDFVLTGFVPKNLSSTETLTVYIEGDGLAWINASQPSHDPTPIHPIGLELALKQPKGVAAYLARPCQYVDNTDNRNCAVTYWTDRRFAQEVIDASDFAVGKLKQRFNANKVELVGYSGGGAIATLVAARRDDVVRLITVAGNLDHERWTKLHHSTPLKNSLNPADGWERLVHVPQVHFVGEADKNMPRAIAESYQFRFPEKNRPEIRTIVGFDHACCWVENWTTLYPEPNGSF